MSLSKVPRVSIIIPTWNSSEFVGDALDGLQAQTIDDWEAIVVDDASEDETCSLVSVRRSRDLRIQLFTMSRHCGPARARNLGIDVAKGRYIAFCDSDDVWRPDKLARQLNELSLYESAVCCTAYVKVNEDGEVASGVVPPPSRVDYQALLRSNPIGLSTAMYDTELCGKVYMPDIARRQDYGLWLRIMREGHEALGIDEPLVDYRIRKGSLSSNKAVAAWYTWRVLREVAELSIPRASVAFASYLRASLRKARI